MKANELRIGNYVYPFDDIDLVSEKTIFRDFVEVEYKDFEDTSHLNQIPLTEEWLLKFDFTGLKELNNGVIEYNDLNIYIGGHDSYVDNMNFIAKCEYVHQLQNLYFALTGKELTLNK